MCDSTTKHDLFEFFTKTTECYKLVVVATFIFIPYVASGQETKETISPLKIISPALGITHMHADEPQLIKHPLTETHVLSMGNFENECVYVSHKTPTHTTSMFHLTFYTLIKCWHTAENI